MSKPSDEKVIKREYQSLQKELDERSRRLWAAAEAISLGHGGVAALSRATGLAESTIRIGQKELLHSFRLAENPLKRRVRQKGAGRKRVRDEDKGLLSALDALLEPTTKDGSRSPLRWTCKSTRTLAAELTIQGHPVSHPKVAQFLNELGYRLQGARKVMEGNYNHERSAQFEYIHERVKSFLERKQPVVSVWVGKREMIGGPDDQNRKYQAPEKPGMIPIYGFEDLKTGKADPCLVCNFTTDQEWVNAAIDLDAVRFAVKAIRHWWWQMGCRIFLAPGQLLVCVEGAGNHISQSPLWKYELQSLADELEITISVSHFPSGTSKWSKTEHRMFSQVTKCWREQPPVCHEATVKLITDTDDAQTDLKITEPDENHCPDKRQPTSRRIKESKTTPGDFLGKAWNYTINPRALNYKAGFHNGGNQT